MGSAAINFIYFIITENNKIYFKMFNLKISAKYLPLLNNLEKTPVMLPLQIFEQVFEKKNLTIDRVNCY